MSKSNVARKANTHQDPANDTARPKRLRATTSSVLSFGLVSIPVRLFAFAPGRSRGIGHGVDEWLHIRAFVPAREIEPGWIACTYYLEPDCGGDRAYALIVDAMTRTERTGDVGFLTRDSERSALLSARNGRLVLSVLHFAEDVLDPAALDVPPIGCVSFKPVEIDLADKLIAKLSTDEPLTLPARPRPSRPAHAEEPKGAEVIDLFEAVRRSLLRTPNG